MYITQKKLILHETLILILLSTVKIIFARLDVIKFLLFCCRRRQGLDLEGNICYVYV